MREGKERRAGDEPQAAGIGIGKKRASRMIHELGNESIQSSSISGSCKPSSIDLEVY